MGQFSIWETGFTVSWQRRPTDAWRLKPTFRLAADWRR
jgi:hypothetical protein